MEKRYLIKNSEQLSSVFLLRFFYFSADIEERQILDIIKTDIFFLYKEHKGSKYIHFSAKAKAVDLLKIIELYCLEILQYILYFQIKYYIKLKRRVC